MVLSVNEERAIRPASLDDFLGQPEIQSGLRLLLGAAIQRGELPDHCLFYGPPGLGKTTLARIVAAELGVGLKVVAGPSIGTAGDLAGVLVALKGDVLFIDEVHRMPIAIEEVLYSAMEDRVIDYQIGTGPSAELVQVALPPLLLIGATTRLGDISAPMRDRFGAIFRLDYYADEQLAAIGQRTASVLGIEITHAAAMSLARRARGTPRIMNRFVRRARDVAQMARTAIDIDVVAETCRILSVDELGLGMMDRRMLQQLASIYEGGPVGLNTLGALISEPSSTVADSIEPHLMRIDLLKRTERGRMLTARGWDYVRQLEVRT